MNLLLTFHPPRSVGFCFVHYLCLHNSVSRYYTALPIMLREKKRNVLESNTCGMTAPFVLLHYLSQETQRLEKLMVCSWIPPFDRIPHDSFVLSK